MAEFSYDQYATLMGEIVYEAINATMSSIGFGGTTEEGFEGTFGGGVYLRITPFGGRYEGSTFMPGGQVYTVPGNYPTTFLIPPTYGLPFEDLQGMSDYWWGQVRDVFDKWWDVPQPQHFDDQVALAEAQVKKLSYGEPGDGGAIGPGVEHFGRNDRLDDIQTIQNRVSNMDGEAMLAFESAFSNKIDDVVNAQAAAACISWGCIAGEQKVWANVQDALANIAGNGRDAMAACRDGGGGNAQAAIRVIGAILSVSGSVLTVGIKVALSVAGTLTGLGASFVPPPEEETKVPLAAEDPWGVLQNIRGALDQLSTDIRKEEQWIADACVAGRDGVNQDRNKLGTPGLVNETSRDRLYPEGEIRAEFDTMKTVANTYMQDIAAEIDSAADVLSGVTSEPWDRPGDIGRGRTGGFSEWNSLNTAIAAAANETALSIRQAADALVQVAENFDATDAEVAADMQAVANRAREQNQAAGY